MHTISGKGVGRGGRRPVARGSPKVQFPALRDLSPPARVPARNPSYTPLSPPTLPHPAHCTELRSARWRTNHGFRDLTPAWHKFALGTLRSLRFLRWRRSGRQRAALPRLPGCPRGRICFGPTPLVSRRGSSGMHQCGTRARTARGLSPACPVDTWSFGTLLS